MALEKKTLFHSVTMDADGNLTLLLRKAVVDGADLFGEVYHRIMVPAGQDVNAFLDANSTNLVAEGFPAIPAAVRSRATQVKTLVDSLPPVDKAKPKKASAV